MSPYALRNEASRQDRPLLGWSVLYSLPYPDVEPGTFLMRTMSFGAIGLLVFSTFGYADDAVAGWQPHTVRQLNGRARQIPLRAQFQILSTESWDRVMTVPYIVYMPEKDRLLMLVACDYPHYAFVMTSDDRGANWTDPHPVSVDQDGKPSVGMCTGLTWLGNGKMLFYVGSDGRGDVPARWFSRDYGQTWGDTVPLAPTPDGKPWAIWDPPLVERDLKTGRVIRLAETGYAWFRPPEVEHAHQQGYIRFSTDEGKTWSKSIKVPEWEGVSEVALLRAGNGDLLGACRTDMPRRIESEGAALSPSVNDGYEGLGISASKDDGHTWSTVEKLYDFGRHHPCLLLMPNQDIVMTYVVRAGYVKNKNGFPQFGIEAVVSHDHGQTWDLDHRYILHAWVGNHQGSNDWWPAPFCASSSLLPDGSIITVFGTAYRSQPGLKKKSRFTPRELGLVRWRLNPNPGNDDRTIRDAPFDSDLRNIIDPSP